MILKECDWQQLMKIFQKEEMRMIAFFLSQRKKNLKMVEQLFAIESSDGIFAYFFTYWKKPGTKDKK
jgi:hypothetical protein